MNGNIVFSVSAEDAVWLFCWLEAAGASLCDEKCWDQILNMKQWLIDHLPLAYKYLSQEHSICKAVCRYFVKASVEKDLQMDMEETWDMSLLRAPQNFWHGFFCNRYNIVGFAQLLLFIVDQICSLVKAKN